MLGSCRSFPGRSFSWPMTLARSAPPSRLRGRSRPLRARTCPPRPASARRSSGRSRPTSSTPAAAPPTPAVTCARSPSSSAPIRDCWSRSSTAGSTPVPALRTAPLGSFEPPRDAAPGPGGSRRRGPRSRPVVLIVVVLFARCELDRRAAATTTARPGAPLAAATTPAPTSSSAPLPTPTKASPRPPVYQGVVLRLQASGGASWVSVPLQRRHGDLPGRAHRRDGARSSATTQAVGAVRQLDRGPGHAERQGPGLAAVPAARLHGRRSACPSAG